CQAADGPASVATLLASPTATQAPESLQVAARSVSIEVCDPSPGFFGTRPVRSELQLLPSLVATICPSSPTAKQRAAAGQAMPFRLSPTLAVAVERVTGGWCSSSANTPPRSAAM